MSHFTTGTSSFVLSKYSRSYPMKRLAHKVQLSPQQGMELSSDWQHFTNPVIRLVLDVKTSSASEIESVKIRILWEMNNGMEACANSQNVIFEDLDLLSFSAPTFGAQRKDQAEGLPLKAVYRDTVVGIRYLHSREEGSNTPIYRRFQISFQIPSEASEFIQTIKPICPCKLNPNNIPGSAASQMHTLPIRPVIQTPAANSTLSTRTVSQACPPPSLPLAKLKTSMPQRATSAFPNQTVSSPLIIHPSSDSSSFVAVETRSSIDQPSLTGGPLTANIQATLGAPALSGPGLNEQYTDLHQPFQTNVLPVVTQNLPASSLPNSSLPSSSNSAAMVPVSAQGHSSEPTRPSQIIQPILTVLEESTSIYNLPNSELERILSEVLHEEGFLQLVERISGMLMVQTLLDG